MVTRPRYTISRGGASTLAFSPDSWKDGFTDIVVSDPAAHTVEFVGPVVWFQASAEME